MADYKPKEINSITTADCVPIDESSVFWNQLHMACWICNKDNDLGLRKDLMYNEFCEMYFHSECLIMRG
jgi:hypothetical protein